MSEAIDLFIIEAPGKRERIQTLLNELGVQVRVIATKGHIFHAPQSLSEHALDQSFREIKREPRDPQRVRYLLEQVEAARIVYIGTDADQEGDVIGWDVATLIAKSHPAPLRVRLRGIDSNSIREALATATPIQKSDATPGRTRSIIDRLIGKAFSKDGVAVGRVSTALLGVIAGHKPTPYRLTLTAPDAGGGRSWCTTSDVKYPLTIEIADRLSKTVLPAISFSKTGKFVRDLPNMGEIMVRASDELDIRPAETDKAMQSLYEAGEISYPRADSKGISSFVDQYLKAMAVKEGVKTSTEPVRPKAKSDVHDAPHPIVPVDTRLDIKKMGRLEAVKTLIARRAIRATSDTSVELAGTDVIRNFLTAQGFSEDVANFVAGLDWSREVGPKYPGQEKFPTSKLVTRSPEAALLEKVVEIGLGRPSTWSKHIDSFMSRGLVDQDLQLTEKGLVWLRASPRALLSPATSIAIEKACESDFEAATGDSREPWEVLANQIVEALPTDLRGPLLQEVAAAPKPRQLHSAREIPFSNFQQAAHEKK